MQIGRTYQKERTAEIPKTVGKTTLFVNEILEKSGQGEAYRFDPASLVYLLPTVEEEEEEKPSPAEERAKEYVLREKETMKLITKEEKSREFSSNIIRERTLSGAVERLREKSWKEQLTIQFQLLLREFREIEKKQQVFFEQAEVFHLQTEMSKLHEVFTEFQKELADTGDRIELWEQEAVGGKREEQVRQNLKEQIEKLFVCQRVLEEQKEEWLSRSVRQFDEELLELLATQPEVVSETAHPAEQSQELPNRSLERSFRRQSEGRLTRTAELLHRIYKTAWEETIQKQAEQSQPEQEQIQQAGQSQPEQMQHEQKQPEEKRLEDRRFREAVRLRFVELVQEEIKHLTKEQTAEIKEELLEREVLRKERLSEFFEAMWSENGGSRQRREEEQVNQVILQILEEQTEIMQVGERSDEQSLLRQDVVFDVQSEETINRTSELLHRIYKVVEEELQLSEKSRDGRNDQKKNVEKQENIEKTEGLENKSNIERTESLENKSNTEKQRNSENKNNIKKGIEKTETSERKELQERTSLHSRREQQERITELVRKEIKHLTREEAVEIREELQRQERLRKEALAEALHMEQKEVLYRHLLTETSDAETSMLQGLTEKELETILLQSLTEKELEPILLQRLTEKELEQTILQVIEEQPYAVRFAGQSDKSWILVPETVSGMPKERKLSRSGELLHRIYRGVLEEAEQKTAGQREEKQKVRKGTEQKLSEQRTAEQKSAEQRLSEQKWLKQPEKSESRPERFEKESERIKSENREELQNRIEHKNKEEIRSYVLELIRKEIASLTEEEAVEIREELLQREIWYKEAVIETFDTEQREVLYRQLIYKTLDREQREALYQKLVTELPDSERRELLYRGLTEELPENEQRELLYRRLTEELPDSEQRELRYRRFITETLNREWKEEEPILQIAEKLVFLENIREQENSITEQLVQNAEHGRETQVFQVLRLLQRLDVPTEENASEKYREAFGQSAADKRFAADGKSVVDRRFMADGKSAADRMSETDRKFAVDGQTETLSYRLSEADTSASGSEDNLTWQQLSERPEIQRLIESRQIVVPKRQETEEKLQYYENRSNMVQTIEKLKEELKEEHIVQFQQLLQKAALQEEQITRIEKLHQELKERLLEQEEKQTVDRDDEKMMKKFQEQLRLERLRRGLI